MRCGPHATFQCQPMNQNFDYSNSFGFDQIQPPQQFDNHQLQEILEIIPFIESKKWIETKNELYKMMKAYTERMNQQREQEALLAAQREQELLAQKQAAQEKEEPPQNSEFRQLIEEICGTKVCEEQKQNMEDTMLELLKDCRQKEIYCAHNDVEDLIENPHSFNAESNLIESLLNRDTLIDSSPKFDYLLEDFSGELAHIDPIPPRIVDTDFEPEEEIRLAENLSYDNSSPRPPEELNAEIADMIVESLSPPPIPVEDNDSLMEETDLFLASDDSMLPGIENDDYDSEGDIRFLEELLSNDSSPLPENESSNLDHVNDPSSPRPPPEPPDVEICLNFEPHAGILTTKMVKGISEHYVLMPNILPTLPTLDPDSDFTPSHNSLRSGNKIFDPGIFIEVQSERLLSGDEYSISFIRGPGILASPFFSYRDKIIYDSSMSPMLIYGGDIPLLDVLFLHFYPP
ncbi:hypothetical protein Tco_0361031 [Tanacetum coccineum]